VTAAAVEVAAAHLAHRSTSGRGSHGDRRAHATSEGHAVPKDEDLGSCPPFGTKAVWGLRYTMEDKWAAVPNMVQVPLDFAAPSRRSTAASALAGAAAACGCIGRTGALARISGSKRGQRGAGSSAGGGAAADEDREDESLVGAGSRSHRSGGVESSGGGQMDALHYFGVYDGHGGAEAAKHCAARMHHVLLECIRQALDGDEAALAPRPPPPAPAPQQPQQQSSQDSRGNGSQSVDKASQNVSGW